MFKKVLLLIILSICIAFMGCGTKQTPSTRSNETSVQAPGNSATPKASPPSQVDIIKTDTERIADNIDKADWTKAEAKSKNIKNTMDELTPILENGGIKSSVINHIKTAVAGLTVAVNNKKANDAKSEANLIMKYLADILDSYKTETPTDINRLDYLGREIQLNAENADWVAAAGNGNKASQIWSILKPKLNDTYKEDSNKFQTSLDNLNLAIANKNRATVKSETANYLNYVDTLEADFKSQNKNQ